MERPIPERQFLRRSYADGAAGEERGGAVGKYRKWSVYRRIVRPVGPSRRTSGTGGRVVATGAASTAAGPVRLGGREEEARTGANWKVGPAAARMWASGRAPVERTAFPDGAGEPGFPWWTCQPRMRQNTAKDRQKAFHMVLNLAR